LNIHPLLRKKNFKEIEEFKEKHNLKKNFVDFNKLNQEIAKKKREEELAIKKKEEEERKARERAIRIARGDPS
jgi:hypothetical protein